MHKHREWNNHITVCNSILLFDVLYRVVFRQERFYRDEIHDIGFRWHCTTYMLYNGVNIIAYYVGLNTTNLKAIGFISLFWGIGLLVHFIFFLTNQRNSIRGYDKDEIFN